MKYMVSLIAFVLVFAGTLSSQDLARRAFLGIQMVPLEDSVKKASDYNLDHGVFLPMVMPEATFGKMGVNEGAILQELNGEKIMSLRDVGRIMDGVKAGDMIEAIVFENGASKKYTSQAEGRPMEDHPKADVEYGTVAYKDNILRSILYLPKGVEQPPVVFFIQGYTCQSIEMRPNNPVKQLIEHWINDGFAVYLAEKPGMGDSESRIPCMDIDFDQEWYAFSQAYATLRKHPKVNTNEIFIFGHSMGGVIAPLLAKDDPPKGILVYGIVGKNWYDYMQDLYTEQPLLFGTSEEEIKSSNAYNLPFIEDLLIKRKPVEELVSSPVYGDFLKQEGLAGDLANGYYIYRHVRFWQTLTDVDIPKAWSEVETPVCVLHGEYDIQAIHPKYGEMITTNVKAHGGQSTFKLFPKSEHAFLKFDSREDLMTTMNNGTYVSKFGTHFNDDIATYSLEWMRSQLSEK